MMEYFYYDYQYDIKDTKDKTIRDALNTLCLCFPHLTNFEDDYIYHISQCMLNTNCKSFFFNLCDPFIYFGYQERKGKKKFLLDTFVIGEL